MSIKKVLFFVFAAVIVLIPVYVAVSSQNVLNNGKFYKFKPMAYDPFDPFRGKFLRVNYETDNIPTKFDFDEGETAYVSIGVDKEGYAFFEEAFKSAPAKGDYLQTKIRYSSSSDAMAAELRRLLESDQVDGIDLESMDTRQHVSIEIPDNMNKYFINEDDALRAEKVFFKEQDNIHIGVKILDGEVRLENIYVFDTPILEYLDSKK